MLAREVRDSASECSSQNPRNHTEEDQHSGQHQGDKATGSRLGLRRRLSDSEGVDERIDEEAEGIHRDWTRRLRGPMRIRLHPVRSASHLTDNRQFACRDQFGRIYWRCRSSKEISHVHSNCYP